ncbi:single-stranded DNA-binding protein [Thermodesulfobacteriota bacterium]
MYNNNQIKADVRLGRQPKIQSTNSGTEVASCSVAIQIGKKDENKKPIWINLKAWKYNAKVLASLSKGDAIRVDGYLDEERWEKDGEQHSRLLIVCNSITKTVFPTKEQGSVQDKPATVTETEDDEIPF